MYIGAHIQYAAVQYMHVAVFIGLKREHMPFFIFEEIAVFHTDARTFLLFPISQDSFNGTVFRNHHLASSIYGS